MRVESPMLERCKIKSQDCSSDYTLGLVTMPVVQELQREAGGLDVRGLPWLYSKSEISLSSRRPCWERRTEEPDLCFNFFRNILTIT